jgi:predicted alpha/beta-hydrolase family hydrolase
VAEPAAPGLLEFPTPHGVATVELRVAEGARGALLLGHGAGGSVGAPDLQAAAAVAVAGGVSVGLVTQPYRVAGKRSTPRPPILDEAWMAVVEGLRGGPMAGLPLVFGGRSSGARVACGCATAGGAAGVLCLAFPLLPPARAGSPTTPASRLAELRAPDVPVLVVQGENDRFGVPGRGRGRKVVVIRGDHGLKADHERLRSAVGSWLRAVV